jgi:hypothetical protein
MLRLSLPLSGAKIGCFLRFLIRLREFLKKIATKNRAALRPCSFLEILFVDKKEWQSHSFLCSKKIESSFSQLRRR